MAYRARSSRAQFEHPMVEQVVRREGEDRVTAAGRTDAGRYLFVAYTMRAGRIRAITAYTLPRKMRRMYDAATEKL